MAGKRWPVAVPGPVDGCVEDGADDQEVEEDARPLGVVHQTEAEEIKENNSTLKEEKII